MKVIFDGVLGRIREQDPGHDAVNPFKGWFDAVITGEDGSKVIASETENLPANPQKGDFAYVKTLDISGTSPTQTETLIAKIYECATAGTWSDSGMTADTSKVQTFKTGQEVNETSIDNDLANPVFGAIPTAEQALQLKAKLQGTTAKENNQYSFEIKTGFVNDQGNLVGRDDERNKTIEIEIPAGSNNIRFLGFLRIPPPGWNYIPGYCFIHYENGSIVKDAHYIYDVGISELPNEYSCVVPSSSTHVMITLSYFWFVDMSSQFYCYFRTGYPALNHGDVIDNLDSNEIHLPLSANMGRQLKQQEEDDANELRNWKPIDITPYTQQGWINPDYPAILNTKAGYSRSAIIPISVFTSDKLKVESKSGLYTEIAFIEALEDTVWDQFNVKAVTYAGSTSLDRIIANTTRYYSIPQGTNYVYLLIKTNESSGSYRIPAFFGESYSLAMDVYKKFDEIDVKLSGTSATEEKYNVVTSTDLHNGYLQSDGSIAGTSSSNIQYVQINVQGYTGVRFNGFQRQSGNSYCGFYDENDRLIGSTTRFDIASPTSFKEYKLPIPDGAVSFKTVYKSSAITGLPDVFYCYLQSGYPAACKFKNDVYIGNYDVKTEITDSDNDLMTGRAVMDSMIPKMYNPKVDLMKQGLKILDVGNSYTQDTTHYLRYIIPDVLKTGFSLYKYIRPSGSFKTALDCYNGIDTEGYYIVKEVGEDIATVEEQTSLNNDGGDKFRKLLNDTKWDIIIIHQESSAAVDYSQWQGDGAGGYLNEYIQLLRKTNPQAALGSMIIHSYAHRLGNAGPTLKRWRKIANSIKKFIAAYGIDFIIPYGTGVECLRLSTLNDGNDFSTDGTHLAEGIGDYVANCVYYQAVFAPRFGISILGNTWRKDIETPDAGEVSVTDDTAQIAQKAAMWATYNWYDVVNADDL